jgi:hypothetical protein
MISRNTANRAVTTFIKEVVLHPDNTFFFFTFELFKKKKKTCHGEGKGGKQEHLESTVHKELCASSEKDESLLKRD